MMTVKDSSLGPALTQYASRMGNTTSPLPSHSQPCRKHCKTTHGNLKVAFCFLLMLSLGTRKRIKKWLG